MGSSVQIVVVLLLVQWTVIVMTTGCLPGGGVDSLDELQEEQNDLACSTNDSTMNLFVQQVLLDLNYSDPERSFVHHPTFFTSMENCRSALTCPGSNVTWCINLYHPTERIQICMDKNGIINATDLARLLRLECFFNVPEQCPRPYNRCIEITQPKYFLHKSVMTCVAENDVCSDASYIILAIEVTGAGIEKPNVAISNTTELVLGETNIFLCTVYFTENNVYFGYSAQWYINNTTPLQKIHEKPYCFLESNCNSDTLATTRDDRVRSYEEIFAIPGCPYHSLFYKEWLWIDNATESDAQIPYRCAGESYSFNPRLRRVTGETFMILTSVLPLLKVTVEEVPVFNHSLPLNQTFQGESFKWTCAVTAGQGDELLWLHNEEVIPTVNNSYSEFLDCPFDGLFVVHLPIKDLGGYRRGFNVTLIACNLPLSYSMGHYQCQLNRSRGDPMEVWSVHVNQSPTPPDSIPPDITPSNQTLIFIIVCVTVTFVGLLVISSLVLIFVCCLKHCTEKNHRHSTVMLDPGLFAATSVSCDVELRGDLQKKLKMTKYDPFEFPREKLLLSDVLLGEGTFGQVIQAKAEGIVQDSPNRNIVAVKTCRENATYQEINELWEELQLMRQLVPHENIVNLLGCCTSSGPLCLIVEFAIHGSLKDYLHQCKDVILQLNHTPCIVSLGKKSSHLQSTSSCTCSSGYRILQEKVPLSQQNSVFSMSSQTSKVDSSSTTPTTNSELAMCLKSKDRHPTEDSGFFGEIKKNDNAHEYTNCQGFLYMEDVQNFALQIAQGLQHLEMLEVVHCDIAARNILIAEGFVLKIGDFGMARDISDRKYYRKHKEGRIPVKWTAPEALQESIFTFKSDIWSYGVLLWEIFTYGQRPYPDQKIRYSLDSFTKYLVDGNRLPLPGGCPPYFYDIMMSCWQLSPNHRPSAAELLSILLSKDAEIISLASETFS